MKWIIMGADRLTGAERRVEVDAETQDEAAAKAPPGMVVSEVTPSKAGDYGPPPITDRERQATKMRTRALIHAGLVAALCLVAAAMIVLGGISCLFENGVIGLLLVLAGLQIAIIVLLMQILRALRTRAPDQR